MLLCISLLCCAEKYTAACFPSKTHTAHHVKHHTVNPLIVPDVNPSCPVSLVQCQCFLLALITVLVSLGCQWQSVPPQCQNATR
ncbi:unnamed protein product, partial [Staurois parvus]